MEVITAVRTIRSEADVHPSAKVQAVLICPDAGKRELLQSFGGSICAMTRAESIGDCGVRRSARRCGSRAGERR